MTSNPSDQTDQMLKACPFCGGAAHIVDNDDIRDWGSSYVECRGSDSCDATMACGSVTKSVAAWNARSPDSAVLVEALEKARPHVRAAILRLDMEPSLHPLIREIDAALASFHKGVSDAG